MFEVIIAIGAILLVVILLTLFRIGTLVNVVKGTDKKVVSASNKVNAALMIVFMLAGFGFFFWYSFTYFEDYTIPVASVHGANVDTTFWITTGVTGFVFVLTNVLLFVFSFKYQHKEGSRATFFPDNVKLEIAWTVVPAIVLATLVFTGLRAWNNITSPASDDAEVIEVLGYQFAWGVRYPGVKDNQLGDYDYRLINDKEGNLFGIDVTDENSYDDFVPLEMHIPKGKEVLLNIRARDVLHSVFIPHFRLKMDAVPGMPTHFKFTATKSTQEMRSELGDPEFDYFITCTEICGRGHFSMKLKVIVDEPEDYEAWKAEQPTWLKLNPDYLDKVPADKRELAIIKAGINKEELEASL
ncbi:cytochrome c oxidase subunit II [Fulvivirga kasyanovii]|uniref:Cytochrome c oxidase subunit 2 n=1 Tax=Fulvivirga kasyanovii TaxID=396812 RepID=A0ABW9RW19_9BACT|nr:cytochrome c oxidase subunit II [Fulvivirga kasyanovii]MTI27454.1 cytochrome c oxidase subunit II [Fulvivirga kasyanovii]